MPHWESTRMTLSGYRYRTALTSPIIDPGDRVGPKIEEAGLARGQRHRARPPARREVRHHDEKPRAPTERERLDRQRIAEG
jgi:hypothetical protein